MCTMSTCKCVLGSPVDVYYVNLYISTKFELNYVLCPPINMYYIHL